MFSDYLHLKVLKMYQIQKTIKRIIAAIVLSVGYTIAWAQDKAADVKIEVTKSETTWYTQPWVWVVGGAVFILLLVALLRGGGKRN
jgi:hypothetical protein